MLQVSIPHNIVHLLFGVARVAGVAAGRASAATSQSFLVGGGVIYLLLWVYGLVVDMGSKANLVPLNNADNWLHLVLGIGMIALGFALARSTSRTSSHVR